MSNSKECFLCNMPMKVQETMCVSCDANLHTKCENTFRGNKNYCQCPKCNKVGTIGIERDGGNCVFCKDQLTSREVNCNQCDSSMHLKCELKFTQNKTNERWCPDCKHVGTLGTVWFENNKWIVHLLKNKDLTLMSKLVCGPHDNLEKVLQMSSLS